jgi:hypothetical protein
MGTVAGNLKKTEELSAAEGQSKILIWVANYTYLKFLE